MLEPENGLRIERRIVGGGDCPSKPSRSSPGLSSWSRKELIIAISSSRPKV